MALQPASPFCGSGDGRAQRGASAVVWLLEVCLALILFLVTSLIHSLYVTGALPAVVLVLDSRRAGSM